jgi:hypothetical protein
MGSWQRHVFRKTGHRKNLNVPERDAEGQAEVRKLLAEGKINTGREYYFADLSAFPSSGNLRLARSIIPKPLVPQCPKGSDEKWTMESCDRTAGFDSMCPSWCVV